MAYCTFKFRWISFVMTPLRLLTLRWYSMVVYWLVISDLVFYLISEYFVQYVQHVLYLFHLSDHVLLLTLFTDRLQQVKDNNRGCHGNWEKVKTIYIFDKLVFDRGHSSLGCFNGATQNDGLWQSVPIRYHTRKNNPCLRWLLQGVIMKDKEWCAVIVSRVA